jgi:hypothetical protein
MKSELKFNILSFLIISVFSVLIFSVGNVFAEDVNQPAAIPTGTLRTSDTALPSQNQSLNVPVVTNPNNSAFKVAVCDGPDMSKLKVNNGKNPEVEVFDSNGIKTGTRPYVVCDFNGAMLQVQHIINIMMVIGVLVAILMFSYAGGLYVTGKQANIDKAHAIFPKIFFGFIIMLSAWFIVYQILGWLTDNDGFKTLLGKP